MSKLFSPLIIKGYTLKNRIVVSPMCQYSSVEDGFANDWHLVHLGSRAAGGAALIIQEATAVSAEGRITPNDLGIYKEEHIEKLSQITRFISNQQALPGIQLAHAGRKASHTAPWLGGKQLPAADAAGWQSVAPGALPFTEDETAPTALSQEGINKVISDFKAAAERAIRAGYKVIEIHAAHGYLIHEFLSPLSNKREDNYGGSLENRARLLLEITSAIQEVLKNEYPLFVRISATDYVDGGWDIESSVKLAGMLKEKAVDLVDCSSGGNAAHVKIPLGPGYQVQFAERVKKETGILTGAVGLITDAQQAEKILQNNNADLVFMARELLRDPYFPLHAAIALEDNIEWPVQYERAKPKK